ncbi:immunoglobulin domain-containing protein [Pedosphaera parvula]|uniref:Immunoglobulin I-set domain protein n=1 Tax=Pedosphaera parvula (strain Ellin514) TaxID=320771 RepID=B9XFI6_PEDPL|nr:immunoglobulin domain-containing protein [Pedosphaera parvula]EEF61350.1 Immunoglobulin I-set domain protein [Pedosphaera parvula Ellin514]
MDTTKKALALLSTSALAAGAAHGAVLYTPVNITLSASGKLNLDLNQDGAPDFQMGFSGAPKPFINNSVAGATPSYVLSGSANQGLPLTVAGTMIDGSYQSAQSTGYFNKNSGGTVVGGWTASGDIEGYVGLELTDGTGTHYGWAHFIFNANGVPDNNKDTGTLRLVDAAMETTPDVGILAGQTAETGAPVVTVSPASQTGYLGGNAQLTVIAQGFPAPTFQWRAGAVGSGVYTNLPNGAGVTDGAFNTLKLQNLTLANVADYVVVVSNAHGAVTSSIPAKLTVLPASDSPATLVHRYSFHDPAGSSTFVDSVGGLDWNGALQGSAALTGSSLHLDGSFGCFASLPPYITSNYTQMTVEFWTDIAPGNPVWTRVFSFGDQTGGGTKNSGVDYCPYAGGNYQNLDLSDLTGASTYANNNAGLNGTTNNHITVIVDSVKGALCYYNGVSVVSTLNGAVPSLANSNDVDNWIGASLVSSDPYLAGTIYEFRVYQGVLPVQAIALNDAVGPANYIQLSANPTLKAASSGGNVALFWPASNFGFAVQSTSTLSGAPSWTTLTNAPALVGTNWQVSLTSTGAARFFRLVH